jgi:ADP-dependent NAD(P)H-hydrate dehydratase / NAD(P)H-hydrate epimerase
VLTPHDREFARLAGDVGDDRIAAARRAARELDVTVLLKGNATVVADPAGRVLVHPAASSWAATAGSGDVLTGMIGALLAAGLEPWWAAGCASYVHAVAADLAAGGSASADPLATAPAPASAMQAAIPDALRLVRRRSG